MNNSDLRLIGRAVRRGWNIPEQVKDALPVAMVKIVAGEGVSKRDQIAAARVLVQMEGQNIALDPPIQKNVNINLSEDQVDELISRELAEIAKLEQQTEAVAGAEGTSPAAPAEGELPAVEGLCPPSVGADRTGD